MSPNKLDKFYKQNIPKTFVSGHDGIIGTMKQCKMNYIYETSFQTLDKSHLRTVILEEKETKLPQGRMVESKQTLKVFLN